MTFVGMQKNKKFTIPSKGVLCYTINVKNYPFGGDCMKLNQCKYCGEMFKSTYTSVVCNRCKELDDILFSRIENYLKQYPNSNAIQIADGLEIPTFEVVRFIDEGRLQFSKGKFERLK